MRIVVGLEYVAHLCKKFRCMLGRLSPVKQVDDCIGTQRSHSALLGIPDLLSFNDPNVFRWFATQKELVMCHLMTPCLRQCPRQGHHD
jgi:hypothetical protein